MGWKLGNLLPRAQLKSVKTAIFGGENANVMRYENDVGVKC